MDDIKTKCLDDRYSTTKMLVEVDNEVNSRTKIDIIDGGLRKKGYAKIDDNQFPLVTLVTVVLNGERY